MTEEEVGVHGRRRFSREEVGPCPENFVHVMSTFQISEQVIVQSLEGEIVLVDLTSDTYFGAPGLGARVWEMLADGESQEEVCRRLAERYPQAAGEIERDVAEFIDALVEKGLVRRAPEAGEKTT